MSSESLQTWAYQLGKPHPNTNTHANVETKPTPTLRDSAPEDMDPRTRSRYDTGGGYEHARSYEYRPHTARQGKEDVYASIHRLCAVAWCFPDGATAEDIDLRGKDVHHPAPGESGPDEPDAPSGVEWLNVHDSPNLPDAGLEVLSHGEHSSVTQSEMRAWGEDAKQAAAEAGEQPARPNKHGDTCPACGGALDVPCASAGFEGIRCAECAKAECDGEPIEVDP